METIFDHNITEKEMLGVLHYITTREEYEKYSTEDTAFADLACLYHIRRNKTKEKEYLNKIKNGRRRYDTGVRIMD